MILLIQQDGFSWTWSRSLWAFIAALMQEISYREVWRDLLRRSYGSKIKTGNRCCLSDPNINTLNLKKKGWKRWLRWTTEERNTLFKERDVRGEQDQSSGRVSTAAGWSWWCTQQGTNMGEIKEGKVKEKRRAKGGGHSPSRPWRRKPQHIW